MVTLTPVPYGVENGHKWVDLGLPSGLKWATCNVGAENPEDLGDFFAWGDPETYYYDRTSNPISMKPGKSAGYDWPSYKWANGNYNNMTKYNNDSSYGEVDGKFTLDLDDDAARINWGGAWRMPTRSDFIELIDNCTTEWTTQNGINGSVFTSKKNGKSIFMPAAGFMYGPTLNYKGTYGDYWSSSLGEGFWYRSWALAINSGEPTTFCDGRYRGFPVRPVTK